MVSGIKWILKICVSFAVKYICTVYWPISKQDQAKKQVIAFIFMAPRRRQINKNRDHTTSKVDMQARSKIDSKKKLTDSQVAA